MNKNKIIHLIQSLDNGGCENMLLRTLPLIGDFEHILIVLNKEGDLSEKFKEKGFEIINIKQKSLLNPFSYFQLIKNVKRINPDIIITYLFHADIIGRIILQLFTKHKAIPFLRTTYNHPKYWIARLIERLTKYFTKQYLANSESVKNFYVENIGVKKEKIIVIPNGIDIDFYDKIERNEKLRESFGIRKEDFVIICVANLHINKGHKYLLEAFEDIYKENKNVKLLLVGDGNEKENLLEQTKNYDSKKNILFLGKRSDVPQLLKISDVFVLPTLFEGMSNAIMEAMASGMPVITTAIPENKELIANNATGFLVPIKNSLAIKSLLEKIIKDIDFRSRVGRAAHEKILKKFNINIVLNKLSAIINKSTNK